MIYRSCFTQTAAIAFNSSSLYSMPVGLDGLLMITALVLSVTAASSCAAVILKFWSSPAIGDDGKVYIQFTDTSEKWGGVLCLKYEGCTGPGQTDWPMMGHDRRRTNCQN